MWVYCPCSVTLATSVASSVCSTAGGNDVPTPVITRRHRPSALVSVYSSITDSCSASCLTDTPAASIMSTGALAVQINSVGEVLYTRNMRLP